MDNSERVACHADGFERNWLEIDARWTRREIDALDKATDETVFDILRPKVTACHVELADGACIDRPQDLTYAQMQDADILVFGWAAGAAYTVIGRRKFLGNLSGRPSFKANADKMTATMDALTPAT